jgi:hypothetical protein
MALEESQDWNLADVRQCLSSSSCYTILKAAAKMVSKFIEEVAVGGIGA